MHHKRSIWNTLSFRVKRPVILVGIGTYSGHFEQLLDLDATITFDRCTTTVRVWTCSGQLVINNEQIMNTQEARTYAKSPLVIESHTIPIHFDCPMLVKPSIAYDVEHNLLPTDVTNHFSGAPLTLMGADLWTCYGSKIITNDDDIFEFRTVEERRRGRCCFEQGQLPYLLYWPCFAEVSKIA